MSSAMASIRAVAWTALLTTVWCQTVPYVPTTILPVSDSLCENHTNGGLYIFSPTDGSVDLLFLDTSSKLDAASLGPLSLTSGLPFVGQSGTSAFTPSVADDGTLAVFAGDCSTPDSEAIWTYSRATSTSRSSGWVKHAAPQSSTTTTTPGAPYLLGGSFSFSSTIAPDMSSPVTYVYGGMCPWANSTAATWQSAATYSDRMLRVSAVGSREGTIYTTQPTDSIGPPIAEAGFTFTALTPALSNRSGSVSQEISYVVLGGHTQGAFINMSTAAVWNLPEETWNIVYVNPPAATYGGSTELAAKAVGGAVEGRSGHTAVLNEDGTALVIYGGWVAGLSQAATPQLVVLEMGSSLNDWTWSVPEMQPSGPGIYGHGAVLLPGNVMMVYGGYSTSSTAVQKERGASQQQMFLNLTSFAWSDEYTNPTSLSSPSTGTSSSSSSSSSTGASSATTTSSPPSSDSGQSHTTKLGLGVGLGLGIPLLLLLVALAVWLRRRRRQKRLQRDEVVRGVAQDAGRFLSADDDDEMAENEHFGSNWFTAAWNGGHTAPAASQQDWYTGGGDPYAQGSRSLGYETLRGKSSTPTYPPPLPPVSAAAASGLNRSRGAARGLYLPTPGIGSGGGYEFGPGGGGGGNAGIHPIYEAEDEDGEAATAAADAAERCTSASRADHASSDEASDPFVTPATTPRGGAGPSGCLYFTPASRSSTTPSPEHHRPPPGRRQPQDAEVQEWVTEVDAADAVLTARIGPHGGTTTTTNTTTTTTTASITPPKQTSRPATRSRRNSLSFSTAEPDEARTASNLSESARSNFSFGALASRSDSVRAAAGAAGAEARRPGSSSGSSSHTYSTAKTNGNGNGGFAGLREEGPSLLLGCPARGYSPEHRDHDNDNGESPPGSPSKHKPRPSWLGSLRRVLSGSGTQDGSSSRTASPEGFGGGSGSDYEPRLVGMGPGGRLLRRKQGKEAWSGEQGEDDDKEEWDVERAVEQRLVQIMFTVPKERLRVVNADVEREEEEEEEEGEIVDPEREGWRDVGDDECAERTRYRREEQVRSEGHDAEARGREEDDRERYRDDHGYHRQKMPSMTDDREYGTETHKLALRQQTSRETAVRDDDTRETLLDVPEQERRSSTPMTPMTPTTFHTAEAVRLERPSKTKLLDVKESMESLEKPKTKVLQMVASIENLSRGGSPAGTPAKEK